ncbi:MAG: 5-deoxy-glucuronate isomerase [Negativicutes bacterium]|nr:5-deoxy-glucuronate isomerase [Negativicutes bacterium]
MSNFVAAKQQKGFQEVVKLGTVTKYAAMSLVNLGAREDYSGDTANEELVLVILSGKCNITVGQQRFTDLGERKDVFSGKATAVYVPIHSAFRIEEAGGQTAEIAILAAYAERKFAPFVVRPGDIVSQQRGTLNFRRDIHDVVIEKYEGLVDRIIVGETIAYPGNWTSFPSHKHDTFNPPEETDMEEIYHYRVKPTEGFGVQIVYTDDLSTREAYMIKDGDTVAIPKGYHPMAAAPGHQLYYLWVMAGPHGRAMMPRDDPKTAWLSNLPPLFK